MCGVFLALYTGVDRLTPSRYTVSVYLEPYERQVVNMSLWICIVASGICGLMREDDCGDVMQRTVPKSIV